MAGESTDVCLVPVVHVIYGCLLLCGAWRTVRSTAMGTVCGHEDFTALRTVCGLDRRVLWGSGCPRDPCIPRITSYSSMDIFHLSNPESLSYSDFACIGRP
jgi:hypothetical protein